ncbi:MAG: tRNA (adenosine(37)-N6)-threonylcarbamoyltransferase complex dimerization subunit type 1 TsaB [Parachlamydia sp.]|nr:MAG: tRNA (adenosine(37)-N6)-threonylcarbamoyltransferase complex dimerization subunit type 1 TsaB [Parachlamydia sp.]
MLTLIIETSTERGLIAILEGDELLFLHEFPFGHNSSSYLLPAIQAGLTKLKIQAQDLDQIVCGQGPGSYTGIRIGAICAKTLAYACDIPLIGVSSLKGFIPDHDTVFSAIIDAKIGGFYVQNGIRQNDKDFSWTAPQMCTYTEVPEVIAASQVLITPSSAQLQAKLLQAIPTLKSELIEKHPSWKALYSAALEEIAAGNASYDAHLELLYLRKTQAEIEKQH